MFLIYNQWGCKHLWADVLNEQMSKWSDVYLRAQTLNHPEAKVCKHMAQNVYSE